MERRGVNLPAKMAYFTRYLTGDNIDLTRRRSRVRSNCVRVFFYPIQYRRIENDGIMTNFTRIDITQYLAVFAA